MYMYTYARVCMCVSVRARVCECRFLERSLYILRTGPLITFSPALLLNEADIYDSETTVMCRKSEIS